jgi:hypothetical protein
MTSEKVCLLPIEGSGGKDMVKTDLWHEIHSRWKLRETKKAFARALSLDVRTVRKVLRQEMARAYERVRKGSSLLAGFEERIRRRVAAVGYCAMSIYEDSGPMGIVAATTS